MAIAAKDVAELRKKTGCGMMDCKKALEAANGDFDEAVKVLREKGLAVAAKKQDRIAAEGIVDILTENGVTAMIEVNTETDFVAKNATFRAYVQKLLKTIIANKPADVDALMACTPDGDNETVEASLKNMIFTIGEKITIRRFVLVDGITSTYVHGMGATGIVIRFEADDAAVKNEGFAEFAKNIALQAAAIPSSYVAKEDVPASALEEEKAIVLAQINADPKTAGKPDAVKEKMVAGKLGKFYEANCLLEQAYVKSEDNEKVGQYVDACAKAFGGKIKVVEAIRFDKGEGLAKREDNFAEEIANMVKG